MAKGKEATRAQRVLITAAVALMASASAIGLGRVFIGREPSVKLTLAAVGAVVLAGLTRRLPVVVSAIVSVLALVVVLGWLFFAPTTFYGVPTLSTVEGLRGLAGLASSEIQTQIAPTVALGGLMVAALAGVWIASWASHCLAARAGAPLLAAVPCLALFTFSDIIVDEGSRPGYYVLVLFGLIAVLFADGIRRVGSWGHLEVWTGPSHRTGSTILRATRGARGVAASVVLIAAVAPGILPGWGHGSVLNPTSLGGGGTTVNPYVTLQANLRKDPSEVLFEVTTERPSYWRMLSLDIFDGKTWTTGDLALEHAVDIGTEGSLRATNSTSGTVRAITQRFELTGLRSPWLPMAWEPSWLSSSSEDIRYNPELVIASGPDEPPLGMTYTVESIVVAPTPEQLDAIPFPSVAVGTLPSGTFERYTRLPPGMPDVVRETAQRLTADSPTLYRQMLSIQEGLRNNFTYDEDVRTPRGVDPLEWFLTESRAGYCQQFAGSMAVMARSLGYPARVAVGFLPGLDAGIDRWTITTAQSHAWPEIWFDGIGWVPFEPTPGRDNPVALSYLSPSALEAAAAPNGGLTRGGRTVGRAQNLNGLRWKGRHGGDLGYVPPLLPARGPTRAFPMVPLLALLLLGAALIPPAKAIRRLWKLRRSRPPRELVLAAYSVFEEEAAEMGFERQPGETLFQHRDTLTEHLPPQAAEIRRLVATASRAAYASSEPDEEAVTRVSEDSRAVIRALRSATPLAQRAKGAFRIRF